jgi:hypothetical protein
LEIFATNYPGIEVMRTYHRPEKVRAEVSVVRRNDIRDNADSIGHLARHRVYRLIEATLPKFDDTLTDLKLEGVNHEEDEINGRRGRFVALQFDPKSSDEIQDENQRIWNLLSRLGQVPLYKLDIPEYCTDLPVAWVPKKMPNEVFEAMQDSLETNFGSVGNINLWPMRLLPRLDRQQPDAAVQAGS